VHPNLPVLEGGPEVLDIELIGERGTIQLEALLNLGALRRGEELGSGRIVVHDEEGSDSC